MKKRYDMRLSLPKNKVFAKGRCGNKLEWILTDGILRVYGIGEMADYVSPWHAYSSLIERVIMDDNVTSVGDYAFYNCSELKEIFLPKGMKKIGELSFYSCSSLSEIFMPDDIELIKPTAFKDCSKLCIVCKKGSYTDGYASDKRIRLIYR